MKIWQAILLGAVQGTTEFLPVSSSGHLILFRRWLAVDIGGGFLFDAFLHIGTLIPVVLVFIKSVKGLFIKPFGKLLYLAIASVPAVITGFLLQDKIEYLFLRDDFLSAALLAAAFIFTAAELIAAQKIYESRKKRLPLSVKSSIIMGVFQGVAVIPGVSRSGTVLTGGTVAGLDGERNAEFTFLMSVPIILGAVVLSGVKAVKTGASIDILPLLFGTLTAAVTGYLSVSFMLKRIMQGKFALFSVYLTILAVASFLTKVIWGI